MTTLLISSKFQAIFARTFYLGKIGNTKGETCFDVFVEYEKHQKKDEDKTPKNTDVVVKDDNNNEKNRR